MVLELDPGTEYVGQGAVDRLHGAEWEGGDGESWRGVESTVVKVDFHHITLEGEGEREREGEGEGEREREGERGRGEEGCERT